MTLTSLFPNNHNTNSATEEDHYWLQQALELASTAENVGEVPVGAILVKEGVTLGRGYNQPIATSDPTAHAEIIALREAATQEKNYRLPNTVLYVTLEPCAMCVGAMLHARVKRLVFGAFDPRGGAVVSVLKIPSLPELNHRLETKGGVLEKECSLLLKNFFSKKRE